MDDNPVSPPTVSKEPVGHSAEADSANSLPTVVVSVVGCVGWVGVGETLTGTCTLAICELERLRLTVSVDDPAGRPCTVTTPDGLSALTVRLAGPLIPTASNGFEISIPVGSKVSDNGWPSQTRDGTETFSATLSEGRFRVVAALGQAVPVQAIRID